MALIAARYELQERLGEGGMGTVYAGCDQQTGAMVAIKQLKGDATTPDMVARFIREGDLLRQLSHPNIVKMLDAVQEQGQHYLIMELVEGGSLADVIATDSPLPVERVLKIALEIADALTRAHHLNIIHRDLKPANILISADGTPRLTDFGIARTADSQMTETGALLGTLAYLSPELLQDQPASTLSDIWAFGVVLFEMLTGQRPFQSEQVYGIVHAILTAPVPELEKARPDAPTGLVDLIYRMLAKNPAERIPGVRLIGAELEALLRGIDITPKPTIKPIEDAPTIIEKGLFATPTPSKGTIPHNLPAQTTLFVGREDELAELKRLLSEPGIRLITIVAPGGMGKTRLSIETANRLIEQPTYPDGVFFISLAPLISPDLIVSTLAAELGYQFQPQGDPQQQLLNYLRHKNMLLVLDNFEHLIAGAGLVNEMLQASSGIKVLATSRVKLNLQGENLFVLEGMAFPEWETPEDALQYAAVKLFMSSASRVRPGFTLQPHDLPNVARICRLTAGMPLAIELAAAWIESLTLEEIATEMQQNLDFLETAQVNVPERQRSIRAVFEYSWRLLSEQEKQVFMRLSVFRGGFTRQAGQAVSGASLRELNNLIGKSLLKRDQVSGRYAIHELLRQYAEEQLKSDETVYNKVCDAQADYYAEYMQVRGQDLKGRRQFESLREVEADLDNILVAWNWNLTYLRVSHLQLMVEGLAVFFNIKSAYHASKKIFESARHSLAEFSEARYVYLQVSVRYASLLHHEEALPILEESMTLALEQSDLAEMARIKTLLAGYYLNHHQEETALQVIEEAIQLYQQLSNEWGLSNALNIKGHILSLVSRPLAESIAAWEETVMLRQRIGDQIGAASALNNLGVSYLDNGELNRGRVCLEQGQSIRQKFGLERTSISAVTLNNLASIYLDEGNLGQAQSCAEQGLQITRHLDDKLNMARLYRMLAGIANLQKDEQKYFLMRQEAEAIEAQLPLSEYDQTINILTNANNAFLNQDYPDAKRWLNTLQDKALGSLEVSFLIMTALVEIETNTCQTTSTRLISALAQVAKLKLRIDYPLILYALARLETNLMRAVELAALVYHHEITKYVFREWAGAFLNKLQAQLAPGEFDAAVTRGQGLNLDETVAQILAKSELPT